MYSPGYRHLAQFLDDGREEDLADVVPKHLLELPAPLPILEKIPEQLDDACTELLVERILRESGEERLGRGEEVVVERGVSTSFLPFDRDEQLGSVVGCRITVGGKCRVGRSPEFLSSLQEFLPFLVGYGIDDASVLDNRGRVTYDSQDSFMMNPGSIKTRRTYLSKSENQRLSSQPQSASILFGTRRVTHLRSSSTATAL